MANDEVTADSQSAINPRSGKGLQGWKYGMVLVGIGFVRILELYVSHHEIRSRFVLTPTVVLGNILLAIVACVIVDRLWRSYYAIPIRLLLTALVGGTVMMPVNSAIGMGLGLGVGGCLTSPFASRLWRTFRGRLLLFVLAGVAGLMIGVLGSYAEWLDVEPASQFGALVGVVVACVVAVALLIGCSRRWIGRMGLFASIACVFSTLLLVPLGIQLDTQRRIQGLPVYVYQQFVPYRWQAWVRGVWEPKQLVFNGDISENQIRRLRVFRELEVVVFQSGKVPSLGLQEMHFAKVWNLQVSDPDGFGDESLKAFQESSNLFYLTIPSTQVTDSGLSALQAMSSLRAIVVSGCDINGGCLQNLHPMAPLDSLVDLHDTKIDDVAIQHLGQTNVTTLNLRNTNVVGGGFRHFARNSGEIPAVLHTLDLSGSAFEEDYLRYLPPSLKNLKLDGVAITAAGLRTWKQTLPVQDSRSLVSQLSLVNTGMGDDGVRALEGVHVGRLRLDATRLTVDVADAMDDFEEVELVFQMDQLNADGLSVQDGVDRFCLFQNALCDERKGRRSPSTVKLGLANAELERSDLEALLSIENCMLYQSQIKTEHGSGSHAAEQIEPHDLLRFLELQRQ